MEQERLAEPMSRTAPQIRPFAALTRAGFVGLAAALMLTACQSGAESPRASATQPVAERSQTVAAPGMMSPADPAVCWAQDRVGGEDRMFAVPCPQALDPETIRTLQRALGARGLYAGPITGEIDCATREGVRRLQAPMGLDSAILSLDAARRLGVVSSPVR